MRMETAYLFLETLLEERKVVVRVGSCGGDNEKSIPFGWAKEYSRDLQARIVERRARVEEGVVFRAVALRSGG